MKTLLDASNLICPMPVIRTEAAVAKLRPGDLLEVESTDPGAMHDIPAWCRIHGHRVRASRMDAELIVIEIEIQPQDG